MWRPYVAKTQNICNAPDKVIMLGNTDLGPILGRSYSVKNSPSARHADSVGSLVQSAFDHDICLMSGSLPYVSWFFNAR